MAVEGQLAMELAELVPPTLVAVVGVATVLLMLAAQAVPASLLYSTSTYEGGANFRLRPIDGLLCALTS